MPSEMSHLLHLLVNVMLSVNNVLNAIRFLPKQTFTYYQNTHTAQPNDYGYINQEFYPPVSVNGFIQPIERRLYSEMGLDLTKSYIRGWSEVDMQDTIRDRSGDQVVWQGYRWHIVGLCDWHTQNGWSSFIAVLIGNASDSESNEPDSYSQDTT